MPGTEHDQVAKGEDRPDSDVDLVADLAREPGLFAFGALERELAQVLGKKVDLVPSDGLRPEVRAEVDAEAIPL